jgi:hypothetical protein
VSGIKTTLATSSLATNHLTTGWQNGRNVSALITQAGEAAQELIALLHECIRDMQTGTLTAASNPSTGSRNITMAQTIPAWVLPGFSVYDSTKGASLGTVLSGAGTSTLVLTANSLSAGTGSSDAILISDPNIAAFNVLISNLS